MVFVLGLAVLFGVGTQVGTRVWHRQQARQFEALLDRLELAAHDAAPAGARAAAPAPRLDLDALADDEDAPDATRAPARRVR